MAETTTIEEPKQQETQPDQEQRIPTGLDDPMLSQLWDDLGIETADSKADEPEQPEVQPEAQPEAKADEPEQTDQPAEVEASEEPATDEKPEPEPEPETTEQKKEFSVKPKLDEDSFRQVIREELEARGKEPDKVEETTAEPEVDPYESQLIDEQKKELDLFRYAESKGKHLGKSDKLLQFYKDLDDYVEKAKREDEGRTFDDQDHEFMDYVRKNKPDIQPAEREELQRFKFRDEIVSDVKKEYEQTINGLKGELNEIKATPQIRATLKEAGRAYDEFAKMGELEQNDPLVHKVYSEERDRYMAWADDFVKRWHGLNNAQDDGYYKLINDIETEADSYARSGNTDRDGKKFLTPSRYAQAKDRSSYWTWDQNDILEHFGGKSLELAKESAEKRIAELESYGFKRGVAPSQSQDDAKDEPEPVNPPKAKRSASPGAADGASMEENHPGKSLIDELGINFG